MLDTWGHMGAFVGHMSALVRAYGRVSGATETTVLTETTELRELTASVNRDNRANSDNRDNRVYRDNRAWHLRT